MGSTDGAAGAGWWPRMWESARYAGAYDLPHLLGECAAEVGAREVAVYLADVQQTTLVPFVDPHLSAQAQPLLIDSTIAGRAYQQQHVLAQEEAATGGRRLWLPLIVDGRRLGVLAATVDEATYAHDERIGPALSALAEAAARLLAAKAVYGDTSTRLQRRADMALAAEIQWGLLPPREHRTGDVTIASALEPAYEVGGDTVDYAVDAGVARLAVFDGMGHGIHSAQLAVVTVGAYRNARRSGASLAESVSRIDAAVGEVFDGDAFSTGCLAELDTVGGALQWVTVGHPPALLLRRGRVVKRLESAPALPFGISSLVGPSRDPVSVGLEHLEPGDAVLLYTDGVIEGKAPDGTLFGLERLADLVTRNLANGLSAPETTRRLMRDLLAHQQSDLRDDASLLLAVWRDDSAATARSLAADRG